MSKATNDKEAGEGNNKIKILGVIIVVAMIVLSSSGVAGYDDNGKNESIESEQNIPELSVSIDKESVEFQVESMNNCTISGGGPRCGSSDCMLFVPVEIINNGNEDMLNQPVVFFVDGEVVEDVAVRDMEGVKRSQHMQYKEDLVEVPIFSILSKSKKEIDFLWKCSHGHHKIEVKAYNTKKLVEMMKPPEGVGVKIVLSDQIKESEANVTVDIKGKHARDSILIACVAIILMLFILIKFIKTKKT